MLISLETQNELFYDDNSGGFFATPSDSKDLILRLKDGMDSQEPSINGISANNLRRLATLLGDDEYQKRALATTSAFSAEILQHPFLFISMMPSIVTDNLGARSILMAGNPLDPAIEKQLSKVRSEGLHSDVDVIFVNMEKWEENDEGLRWLAERNPTVKAAAEYVRKHGKAFVEVCAAGRCEMVETAPKEGFDMGDVLEVLKGME